AALSAASLRRSRIWALVSLGSLISEASSLGDRCRADRPEDLRDDRVLLLGLLGRVRERGEVLPDPVPGAGVQRAESSSDELVEHGAAVASVMPIAGRGEAGLTDAPHVLRSVRLEGRLTAFAAGLLVVLPAVASLGLEAAQTTGLRLGELRLGHGIPLLGPG